MQGIRTKFQKDPGNVRLTILLAACFVVVLCFCAIAEENQPLDTSIKTEPGTVLPTIEELDTAIGQLKKAKDQQSSEEEKKNFDNLIDIYEKAKAKYIEIQKFEASIIEFQNARKLAPERLVAIQGQLEQIPAEPKIEEVFTDWSLTQIEQQVAQKEAELTGARNNVAECDSETQQRSARRTEIPQATARARELLENIKKESGAKPAVDMPQEVVKAQRTVLSLTEKSLQKEIESYTEELLSYDARGELLAAQKDLAVRQVSQYEKLLKQWQDILNQRRELEAEQTAEKARQAIRDAAQAHPIVRALAKENAQLAELRTGPRGLIAINTSQANEIKKIDKQLADLNSEFGSVKEKVETAGFSDVIGVILLGKRNEISDISQNRRNIKDRRAETANAYFESIKYTEQRTELADIESSTNIILKDLEPSLTDDQRLEIGAQVKKLLEARRELLNALTREYENYRSNLVLLDITERKLVARAGEYAKYIDENILWVKNTKSMNISTFSPALETLRWLAAPKGWWQILQVLGRDMKAFPFGYSMVTLFFAILFYLQKRLRGKMESISVVLHKKYTDRFTHTLRVFLFTVILSVSVPSVLFLLWWRLALPELEFVSAVAAGLRSIALVYLFLSFLRLAMLPQGLAAEHFLMPEEAIIFLRRHLSWFMACILPLIFVITVIDQQTISARKESLGRIIFIAALVVLSIFFAIIIRPSGRLMKVVLQQKRGGWLDRLSYIWFPFSVIFPLVLALSAIRGYYYATQQLAACLKATIMWIIFLVIISALIVRWLTVTQNRLLLIKERQRLEAASKQETSNQEQPKKAEAEILEPHEDISQSSLQMRRFMGAFLVSSLIVGFWLIWKDVLPALGIFNQVELWTTTAMDGKVVSVTLTSLFLALIIIVITTITARNIPGLLELVILQRLPLDRGVRFAIVTLTRYIIVIVGIVMTFSEIGLGWSKVQWLVAAVTVGLGFGLQEIFANFVSGLIILFEQPMRVGDTVTVGDVSGKVTRIRTRATTIRKWDRKELLVPNREFITGRLINWTLSDTILRMAFPVGIAYGSDTALAEKVLLEIARNNKNVLQDPEPVVIFKGFGSSALEFDLRLYIPDLDSYLTVWHGTNLAIDEAFRKAGIEIAFPQQDIHVRSITPLLQAELKNTRTSHDNPESSGQNSH